MSSKILSHSSGKKLEVIHPAQRSTLVKLDNTAVFFWEDKVLFREYEHEITDKMFEGSGVGEGEAMMEGMCVPEGEWFRLGYVPELSEFLLDSERGIEFIASEPSGEGQGLELRESVEAVLAGLGKNKLNALRRVLGDKRYVLGGVFCGNPERVNSPYDVARGRVVFLEMFSARKARGVRAAKASTVCAAAGLEIPRVATSGLNGPDGVRRTATALREQLPWAGGQSTMLKVWSGKSPIFSFEILSADTGLFAALRATDTPDFAKLWARGMAAMGSSWRHPDFFNLLAVLARAIGGPQALRPMKAVALAERSVAPGGQAAVAILAECGVRRLEAVKVAPESKMRIPGGWIQHVPTLETPFFEGAPKQVAVVLPVAMPGTGTSHFLERLIGVLEKRGVVVLTFSSDELSFFAMSRVAEAKPGISRQTQFTSTRKECSEAFRNRLDFMRNIVARTAAPRFAVLLDKNFMPMGVKKEAEDIVERFRAGGFGAVKVHALTVKYTESFKYEKQGRESSKVMSLKALFDSFVRVMSRKEHLTIDPLDHEKIVEILLGFFENFRFFPNDQAAFSATAVEFYNERDAKFLEKLRAELIGPFQRAVNSKESYKEFAKAMVDFYQNNTNEYEPSRYPPAEQFEKDLEAFADKILKPVNLPPNKSTPPPQSPNAQPAKSERPKRGNFRSKEDEEEEVEYVPKKVQSKLEPSQKSGARIKSKK